MDNESIIRALRPLADLDITRFDRRDDNCIVYERDRGRITVGDIRRASEYVKHLEDQMHRERTVETHTTGDVYAVVSAVLQPEPQPVTEHLVSLLRSRAELGLRKYGTTLDRPDLSEADWLQHLLEELLDAAGYIEAARRRKLALPRTELRYTADEVEGMLKERTAALLAERDAVVRQRDQLFAQVKARDEKLDAVYSERNALAVALAKTAIAAGYFAGKGVDTTPDTNWDPEWLNVVYVELPGVGQVSWHIGPRDVARLDSLPEYHGEWDGTAHGRDVTWPDRIEFRAIRTIDKESIRQQAAAWEKVWATLCKVVPGFTRAGKTGEECACDAIRELAARVPRDIVVTYVRAGEEMHTAEREGGGFRPSRLRYDDPRVLAYRRAKAALIAAVAVAPTDAPDGVPDAPAR